MSISVSTSHFQAKSEPQAQHFLEPSIVPKNKSKVTQTLRQLGEPSRLIPRPRGRGTRVPVALVSLASEMEGQRTCPHLCACLNLAALGQRGCRCHSLRHCGLFSPPLPSQQFHDPSPRSDLGTHKLSKTARAQGSRTLPRIPAILTGSGSGGSPEGVPFPPLLSVGGLG